MLKDETIEFMRTNTKIEIKQDTISYQHNKGDTFKMPGRCEYFAFVTIPKSENDIINDVLNYISDARDYVGNFKPGFDLIVHMGDSNFKLFNLMPIKYSENGAIVIEFAFDYYEEISRDWRDWFLTDEDRKKYYASL